MIGEYKTFVPPLGDRAMSERMTSRDRVLTALAHREPDHVPCWLGASPEWKEIARAHLALPDEESLLVYLGDDFRRVSTKLRRPLSSPDGQLEPSRRYLPHAVGIRAPRLRLWHAGLMSR